MSEHSSEKSHTSNWKDALKTYEQLIENKVLSIIEREYKNASKYHPFIKKLYLNLNDFISRKGRRLASCSLLIVYEGFNGSIDDAILSACAGMEFYRHSILVHDDLADRDEFRRNAPTLHKIYAKNLNEEFGGNVALFAGNILYALAIKTISRTGFEPETSLRAIQLLSSAFQDVNESQILDVLFEYDWPDPDEWHIMASKRAASLFKAAFLIGGTLAKASHRDLSLLNMAAEHIGYCFDIQDDIIDTFATKDQYGRTPGGDITKRKKPLHIIYTKLMGKRSRKDMLDKMIGKELSNKELEEIKHVIIESGALEKTKSKLKHHARLAKRFLSETSMQVKSKNLLSSLIDYIQESLNWYQ